MTSQQQAPEGARAQSGLPLFYKNPVVLRVQDHKESALAPFDGYGFAAKTNAAPLTIAEFLTAARHYPIVFAGDNTPIPVAALGLQQDQNLFVAQDGNWRQGAYVPAYVRRYPFVVTEFADRPERLLAIDVACARVVKNAPHANHGRLFSDDGDVSPFARQMMTFCNDLYDAQKRTYQWAQDLMDADLLVTRQADMRFADHSQYRLQGFRVVDAERYRNLSAETLKVWQGKGWLMAIELHLASMQNWDALLALHADMRVREEA